MNPRNTFYRDSGALAYGTVGFGFSLLLSSSLFPPFFFLSFLFFSWSIRRTKRGPFAHYDIQCAEVRENRWNSTRPNGVEKEESKRNGPRADDIFSLGGSDTASRVYTRELDVTLRGDSGCRPVHAQAPKRHLNYRPRLFMSRRAVTPSYRPRRRRFIDVSRRFFRGKRSSRRFSFVREICERCRRRIVDRAN